MIPPYKPDNENYNPYGSLESEIQLIDKKEEEILPVRPVEEIKPVPLIEEEPKITPIIPVVIPEKKEIEKSPSENSNPYGIR